MAAWSLEDPHTWPKGKSMVLREGFVAKLRKVYCIWMFVALLLLVGSVSEERFIILLSQCVKSRALPHAFAG